MACGRVCSVPTCGPNCVTLGSWLVNYTERKSCAFKNSRRDLVVVNRTILAEENLGLLRFIPRRIWQAISLHHSLDEMKNVRVASDNIIMSTLGRLERRFPGIKNEILRRS